MQLNKNVPRVKVDPAMLNDDDWYIVTDDGEISHSMGGTFGRPAPSVKSNEAAVTGMRAKFLDLDLWRAA